MGFREVPIEDTKCVYFCDACGKDVEDELYLQKCSLCGKSICYKCRDKFKSYKVFLDTKSDVAICDRCYPRKVGIIEQLKVNLVNARTLERELRGQLLAREKWGDDEPEEVKNRTVPPEF